MQLTSLFPRACSSVDQESSISQAWLTAPYPSSTQGGRLGCHQGLGHSTVSPQRNQPGAAGGGRGSWGRTKPPGVRDGGGGQRKGEGRPHFALWLKVRILGSESCLRTLPATLSPTTAGTAVPAGWQSFFLPTSPPNPGGRQLGTGLAGCGGVGRLQGPQLLSSLSSLN